ncbi:hypothetical protein B0T16DRAFT_211562 [Cercophora newfieldiana]|uniref:Uncharacterized protein n=1 Tax=Cercophora newfieldiana TaxID=92897 RepID=A0AA40CJZ7_9PEZI|nr:hypothetical protein B0T16DRAFT_211562 [Cercophora newfieldiana]
MLSTLTLIDKTLQYGGSASLDHTKQQDQFTSRSRDTMLALLQLGLESERGLLVAQKISREDNLQEPSRLLIFNSTKPAYGFSSQSGTGATVEQSLSLAEEEFADLKRWRSDRPSKSRGRNQPWNPNMTRLDHCSAKRVRSHHGPIFTLQKTSLHAARLCIVQTELIGNAERPAELAGFPSAMGLTPGWHQLSAEGRMSGCGRPPRRYPRRTNLGPPTTAGLWGVPDPSRLPFLQSWIACDFTAYLTTSLRKAP